MTMEFQELTNKEASRTYIFSGGEVVVANVARICVRPSGSHRLETETGEKYIVPAGWLAIKVVAEKWSI